MKKNHGKLLAYALAGALSVGNLSGVVAMPFSTIVAQAADVAVVMHSDTNAIRIKASSDDYNGAGGIYCPQKNTVIIEGEDTVPVDDKLLLEATTGTNTDAVDEAVTSVSATSATSYRYVLPAVTANATTTFKLYRVAAGTGAKTLVDSLTVNYVERKRLVNKSDMSGKTTLKDVEGTIYTGSSAPTTITATLGTINKSEYITDDATFELKMTNSNGEDVAGGVFSGSPVLFSNLTSAGITGTFSPTDAGTYTANLWYDADGSGVEFSPVIINSKNYTAVASAIQSIDITEATDTSVLVNKADFADQKKELSLTAVATADDVTGVPADLNWGVYAADDTTYSKDLSVTEAASGKFLIAQESPKTLRNTLTSEVTITAASEAVSGIPGGDYVAIAYKAGGEGEKLSPVGVYPFTVVDIPDATIEVQNDDRTAAALYEGSTGKVKLYLDGAYKDSYKSATFKLKNSTDSAYVDLNSDGTFEIKKYDASHYTIPVVLESYDLGEGVTLKNTEGTITISPATVVGTWVGKTTGTLESMTVGEEAALKVTYGSKDVTDEVTFDISNSKYVSVDDGVVTALEATSTPVKITAKYGSKGSQVFTITEIVAVTYDIVDANTEEAKSTANLRPGKSIDVELVATNGKPITDTVTWKTDNKSNAVVTGNGKSATITVPADAEIGGKAKISAFLGDSTVAIKEIEITVIDAIYTATAAEVSLAGTAPDYKASLFNTETLTLTALYDDEEIDGKWSLSGEGNNSISLKGNVVTATTSPKDQAGQDKDDENNAVVFTPTGAKAPTITVEITVKADKLVLSKNGKALAAKIETVDKMEVGESITYTLKNGAKDVTNNYVWKSNNKAVTVNNGVVTAEYESSNIEVTAHATAESEAAITITITKVIESTGAADDAAVAEGSAITATDKADAATAAAADAAKAAEATKTAPTAENLTKAENALTTATATLAEAKEALAEAQDALAKAEADGAVSDTAKQAVKDAATAVADAEAAVADAEAAVESAKKTFDEAATEVEKAKKAEEEKKAAEEKAAEEKKAADEKKAEEEKKAAEEKAAADKKAADQAIGATGTDAATGTSYKVTDTAAKTVGFTGSTSTNKKQTIPSSVVIDGDTFAVTSIEANAFKDSAATELTIGSNITKIDPSAFKGSKIKKVFVKSVKLNKSSAKAFNKLKKGATVKVTGKNKKANKKLLNNLKNVKNGKIKVK